MVVERIEHPLFYSLDAFFDFEDGGHAEPLKARHLSMSPCGKQHAVEFIRAWHSRLPSVQDAPWMYSFKMSFEGITYAAALWNNPSARTLPGHWIELRRMACSDDAPKYTASRFLGLMVRWLKKNHPEHEKCISYQDTEVHKGTIYRAAGWTAEYTSKKRTRDRSKKRTGTNRAYRSNINGIDADSAKKIRWGISLVGHEQRITPHHVNREGS